jgi:hypothetical protein
MQYWGQIDDVLEKAGADYENVRQNCGLHHATTCGDGVLESQTYGSDPGVATY